MRTRWEREWDRDWVRRESETEIEWDGRARQRGWVKVKEKVRRKSPSPSRKWADLKIREGFWRGRTIVSLTTWWYSRPEVMVLSGPRCGWMILMVGGSLSPTDFNWSGSTHWFYYFWLDSLTSCFKLYRLDWFFLLLPSRRKRGFYNFLESLFQRPRGRDKVYENLEGK